MVGGHHILRVAALGRLRTTAVDINIQTSSLTKLFSVIQSVTFLRCHYTNWFNSLAFHNFKWHVTSFSGYSLLTHRNTVLYKLGIVAPITWEVEA